MLLDLLVHAVVVRLVLGFCVLVEALELTDKRLGHGVYWCNSVGSD